MAIPILGRLLFALDGLVAAVNRQRSSWREGLARILRGVAGALLWIVRPFSGSRPSCSASNHPVAE